VSRRTRIWIFWVALLVFGGLFLWGLTGLPPVGNYPGPYGDVINAVAVNERHVTDMVSAVNFDYRGFDTLGEEFILFASVMGVLLLLRQQHDETKARPVDQAPQRAVPRPSDGLRAGALLLLGSTVLFGLYMVTHGQLSPGGGFQGGVIIIGALLLVYLAGDFERFRKLLPHQLVEITEALGAGGYALTGLAGMVVGVTFLQNVLPLGEPGQLYSGGTIYWLSIVAGLEVSSGLFLLCTAYLEEMLEHYRRGEQP
jgi:multicomponent Na+:H+ antiporter subunit B